MAGLALAFVAVMIRPDLVNLERRGPAPQPASYAAAVAASSPAVVNIYTERLLGDNEGRTYRDQALGSGVVINPQGYVVTNWHVIAGADQVRLQLADGRIATPMLVGADPETELALLKIDLPDLPVIRLGRSDDLAVGEVVLAIGNSLGLSHTVTMGIVSATGRGDLGVTTFEDFVQTDAAINPGNSGGALINARGELVGINTAISDRGTVSPPEGIGFAIPVNLVRGVMAQLIEHGRRFPAEHEALVGVALAAIGQAEEIPAGGAGCGAGAEPRYHTGVPSCRKVYQISAQLPAAWYRNTPAPPRAGLYQAPKRGCARSPANSSVAVTWPRAVKLPVLMSITVSASV